MNPRLPCPSAALCLLCTALSWGCGGSEDTPEPPQTPCSDEHLFELPAVPLSSVTYLGPIGTLAPVGGSPLPKAHTGFILNTTDVDVQAPGAMTIVGVRETTYVTSPTRQGYQDYSLYFNVCDEVHGNFGHLSSLSPVVSSALAEVSNCQEYDTVDETIRNCEATVSIHVEAGDALGTSGASHSQALDIGMRDTRLRDYLNPSRYGSDDEGSLCPWDWHAAGLKDDLYALIGGAFGPSPDETPKCGTMAVDLDGTAKGRWTPRAAPADGQDPAAGDFFVLTNNPFASQSEAVISTRIGALDTASLPVYSIEATGRLNVAPADITADGQIYCYDENTAISTFAYLVQVSSESVLTAEKLTHAAGASVCAQDPSTWSFGPGAVELIR